MRAWLGQLLRALEQGRGAVLVHVAAVEGSAPREPGAQMLVTEEDFHGTIGGGELEYRALRRARDLLVRGEAALERWPLGPELAQCCGGAVTLVFEPFAPADLAWARRLAADAAGPVPVFRSVRIDASGRLVRAASGGPSLRPNFLAERTGNGILLTERVNAPRPALFLFGAGHVGHAVARALHPLGFEMTWIDGRSGFAPAPPEGVRLFELAMPELVVEEAPPGAVFLVMTHIHDLDLSICEAVLRRGDFAYLGLIGSKTKRARFAARLREAGVPHDALARLVCPIGLAGIKGKAPAVIAASVAADLLIRRQSQTMEQGAHVGQH
ncbi:xanthine dehydrogenase accessory protein XdhC [Faunimonas sp. B44]|uniref:xanthine dehydrogenase accessory protein XdhC n=1 Tax=Faunimonas sp. B44 TaxID=3461493 RepID=UPI004043C404